MINSSASEASSPSSGTELTAHLAPRATLASLHGGTMLALWFYAYVIHAKVEIQHPVFAIIFQEVVVLSLSETTSFVALLAAAIDYEHHKFVMLNQMVSQMFHQWSWLVITCLRYDREMRQTGR